MASAFDPYHVWLGIPPGEQPPHHYRLLAIAPFEPSPEVIENAAERQMAHVRRAAHGKHADESQRILNEIAAAQRALLDVPRKAKYDAELRVALGSAARGMEQTMEWTAKPPALPAAPPVRNTAAVAPPANAAPPARWKALPPQHSPTDVPAPVSFSPAIAAGPGNLRARAKQRFPMMLVAVLAIVAILPVLALVAALAMMQGEPAVAESDDARQSQAAADDAPLPRLEPSPTTRDAEPRSEPPATAKIGDEPRLPQVRPVDNDTRDPFDDSPSFGRASGEPTTEQSVTVSARTLLPRLAFFSLPADARTPIEVKAGQIVKLKIEGEWRIAPSEPRGVDALFIAVGHAGQPATQFAQGASQVEFNVQKDGRLFMGVEDLLNFDNSGAMTVDVSIY